MIPYIGMELNVSLNQMTNHYTILEASSSFCPTCSSHQYSFALALKLFTLQPYHISVLYCICSVERKSDCIKSGNLLKLQNAY